MPKRNSRAVSTVVVQPSLTPMGKNDRLQASSFCLLQAQTSNWMRVLLVIEQENRNIRNNLLPHVKKTFFFTGYLSFNAAVLQILPFWGYLFLVLFHDDSFLLFINSCVRNTCREELSSRLSLFQKPK